MRETWVQSLGREDSLEKEIATHSSTLAQKIPWTEEPGAGNCPWGRKESDTISKGNLFKRECLQESSGGLVVRTLSSQSQQSRFDPWSELRSFMAWSKKKKWGRMLSVHLRCSGKDISQFPVIAISLSSIMIKILVLWNIS